MRDFKYISVPDAAYGRATAPGAGNRMVPADADLHFMPMGQGAAGQRKLHSGIIDMRLKRCFMAVMDKGDQFNHRAIGGMGMAFGVGKAGARAGAVDVLVKL